MRSRKTLLMIVLSLILILVYQAVSARTVDELRVENDKRTWIYLLDEEEFGTLESVYKGETVYRGRKAWKYEEKLTMNYVPLGQDYVLEIVNDHYVDQNGAYIGDEMTASTNNIRQTLSIRRVGDSIKGEFVSNESVNPVAIPIKEGMIAYDNNLVDQLDMFLGLQDMAVGDTITDTLFIPQTMTTTPFSLYVEEFGPVRYGDVIDSAYQCKMLEPADIYLFVTRDHKLVRMVHQSQKIITILKEDPMDKFKPKTRPYTFGSFIGQAPIYFLYLVFGFIVSLPVIRKYYKRPETYVMLILGALAFPIIKFTLIPLQGWYSTTCMIPAIREGGSAYNHAFIMSLITGTFKTILVFLPLLLVFLTRKPGMRNMVIMGIFCGIGFGIYQSGFTTGESFQYGGLKIISWAIFQQLFLITFHAAAGAALAFGLSVGRYRLVIIGLIIAFINTIQGYLVIYYQRGIFDLGIYSLLVALISLISALAIYMVFRRYTRRS